LVIDGCAGAGGKTLHLAALMRNQGRLVAMDVVPTKLRELENRARRNGVLIVETQLLDEAGTQVKNFHAHADRVLLDVPCSGTGVLRRKPDTKWRLTEDEVARLVTLQARILKDYSAMVKPGGKLVYATCSILPQENEQQITAFLMQSEGAWKLDEQRSVRPDVEGWDGFYLARLQRLR
jgi:16S rRNA (cytosine967-C5)-methyltransferase